MAANPLVGFTVDPAGVRHVGRDLQRPESVVAMPDGTPWQMAAAKGQVAPLTSSVAFGGADRRDVYLGSLAGTRIAQFRSPVAGLPMSHWRA